MGPHGEYSPETPTSRSFGRSKRTKRDDEDSLAKRASSSSRLSDSGCTPQLYSSAPVPAPEAHAESESDDGDDLLVDWRSKGI